MPGTYDSEHVPKMFTGNSVVGYELKQAALTEGELEAVRLLCKGKSIKARIDKDSDPENPTLKAGGLVKTVEWVAAKCKEFGC